MEDQEKIRNTIAGIIREASVSGHLIRGDEILSELEEQGLVDAEICDHGTDRQIMLKQALAENQDLAEMEGRKGVTYYYSALSMNGTYAGILMRKSEDPVWMIAEVVRDNSRIYPRPVPMAGFNEPPFDLTGESMSKYLEALGGNEEYQDIARVITSCGNTFLFSTHYLDPDYAAMLAEWSDVGQANNP